MEHIDKVVGTFEKTDETPLAGTPNVSPAVIRRLPRYHRYLRTLLDAGRGRISSKELSELMNVTASQIRQDLNCFGGFGQQGYGYNVKYLYGKISELLGVHENYTTVIIGAGNLGKALASTHMFERRGILRLAMFDNNEKVVGTQIFGLPVLHVDTLEAFCAINRVDFAVLTTPWEAAPAIVERLSKIGVRGVWNFSNMELGSANKDMIIENIHLSDSLMKLCFDLKKASEEKGEK
ncbi:MAG: redox-sensing transcriptional repressor Rex [Clostridia bacterium]|nr:redox-sensing transcriptional repressor Rex [Clostridia bacterium]